MHRWVLGVSWGFYGPGLKEAGFQGSCVKMKIVFENKFCFVRLRASVKKLAVAACRIIRIGSIH